MQYRNIVLAAAMASGLAACGQTSAERTLSGAAIGGATAYALGGSATAGVVVGAAAGLFCDDVSPSYCLQ